MPRDQMFEAVWARDEVCEWGLGPYILLYKFGHVARRNRHDLIHSGSWCLMLTFLFIAIYFAVLAWSKQWWSNGNISKAQCRTHAQNNGTSTWPNGWVSPSTSVCPIHTDMPPELPGTQTYWQVPARQKVSTKEGNRVIEGETRDGFKQNCTGWQAGNSELCISWKIYCRIQAQKDVSGIKKRFINFLVRRKWIQRVHWQMAWQNKTNKHNKNSREIISQRCFIASMFYHQKNSIVVAGYSLEW